MSKGNKNICSECNNEFPNEELLRLKNEEQEIYFCKKCKDKLGLKTPVEYIQDLKANMLTPKEMVSSVSKYVIGQEDAMKTLAVEIRKHFLRITMLPHESIDMPKKNNILLIGPTASGKSYMVERFAKEVGLPFASIDATTVSPTGYAGADINSVLLKLLRKGKSEFMAQKGIVFIDEFDKILENKSSGDSLDIRGKMLQQSLLRMLEGDVVEVSEQISPGVSIKTNIDTSNILFICAGAFVGIEDIIKKRLKVVTEKTVGFNVSNDSIKLNKDATNDYYRKQIKPEDIISYGFIPEIVGRLPITLTLNKLSVDQIIDIIKTKGGILEEYKILFKNEGKDFRVEEDAIRLLAHITHKSDIGARGLRNTMAKITDDIFYNIDKNRKKSITLSVPMIKETLPEEEYKGIELTEKKDKRTLKAI